MQLFHNIALLNYSPAQNAVSSLCILWMVLATGDFCKLTSSMIRPPTFTVMWLGMAILNESSVLHIESWLTGNNGTQEMAPSLIWPLNLSWSAIDFVDLELNLPTKDWRKSNFLYFWGKKSYICCLNVDMWNCEIIIFFINLVL